MSAEDDVLVEKIVTSLLRLTKLVRTPETTIGRLRYSDEPRLRRRVGAT